MGIGEASGDNRAADAADRAMNNPLLEEGEFLGAKSMLVSIASSSGITLMEQGEIMHYIAEKADEGANIISGVTFDDNLGDKVVVTLIATGFNAAKDKRADGKAKVISINGGAARQSNNDLFSSGEFDSLTQSALRHGERLNDPETPAYVRAMEADKAKAKEDAHRFGSKDNIIQFPGQRWA
jgi:cell division protein FtsZ